MNDEQQRNEVFEYLDNLRESGATNMFGSASWLMDEFDFDKETAKRWVAEWMRTFEERHTEREE